MLPKQNQIGFYVAGISVSSGKNIQFNGILNVSIM